MTFIPARKGIYAKEILRLVDCRGGVSDVRIIHGLPVLQHAVLLRLLREDVRLEKGPDHSGLSTGGIADTVGRAGAGASIQPVQDRAFRDGDDLPVVVRI